MNSPVNLLKHCSEKRTLVRLWPLQISKNSTWNFFPFHFPITFWNAGCWETGRKQFQEQLHQSMASVVIGVLQCPFFPSCFKTTGSKILNLIKLKLCIKYLLDIAFYLFILKDNFPHIAANQRLRARLGICWVLYSWELLPMLVVHAGAEPLIRIGNLQNFICDLMSVKLTTMRQGTSGVEWRNSAFFILKASQWKDQPLQWPCSKSLSHSVTCEIITMQCFLPYTLLGEFHWITTRAMPL